MNSTSKKNIKNGYKKALKATSITGGSTVVVMLLRLIRMKCIAVLLGPAGVGLFGLLNSVSAMTGTVVGLGFNKSAVRQVALASASGDDNRLSQVVYVLRKTTLFLGILGGVAMVIGASFFSRLVSGSSSYSLPIAILGIAVVFDVIGGSQTALLRGLRKVKELALLGICSALASVILSVPLILWLGTDAIAPSIIVASATTLLGSWWYARSFKTSSIQVPWSVYKTELAGLISLGSVLLITQFLNVILQFGFRTFLFRQLGIDAIGKFQAAVTLSMVSVSFVFQAVSLDYYPRLTGASASNSACNRIICEQVNVSVLFAGPATILCLVYAPFLVTFLYSGEFAEAAVLLKWQCIGVLFHAASWPLGYVLLARGRGLQFLTLEVVSQFFHFGIFCGLTHVGGLFGAGLASPIFKASYFLAVLLLVHRETALILDHSVRFNFITILAAGVSVVVICEFLLSPLAFVACNLVLLLLVWHSYREFGRCLGSPLASAVYSKAQKIFLKLWR